MSNLPGPRDENGIPLPMTVEESIEVSAVHSLAGHALNGLITRPPFADPHHSVTPVALVGRWRGRDELRLRRRAGATSHWIDREHPGPQPESFRNQF